MTLLELKERLVVLWDNPSTEHDAREILSAFKVGVWLTLLNLAIAGGVLFVILGIGDEAAVRRLILGRGLGACLSATVQLVLVCFLTLILPIRAGGVLDGPRRSGYLDQVVSTGITPGRFFLGKWLSSQVFVLVLMIATLPYIILFSCFGVDSYLEPLWNFISIYMYANALLLVTFALGTVLYEWAAAAVVILVSVGLGAMEFAPIPSTWVFWTPVRLIIAPFARYMAEVTSGGQEWSVFYTHAPLFGFAINGTIFRVLCWALISAVSVAVINLGPRHFFSVGLNNFDAVVIGGDSRRAMFFRMRPLLTRRVQLAFFYENRSSWLVRHDLAIRALLRFVVFSFLIVLGMGGLFSRSVILPYRMDVPDFFVTWTSMWMVLLTLATVTMVRVRTDFRSVWRFSGGRTTDVVSLDVYVLTGLMLLTLLGTWGMTSLCGGELAALKVRPRLNLAEAVRHTLEWIAITYVYLLSVQFVSKLMGLANLSRAVVGIFVILFMLVSLLGPLLIGGLFSSLARTSLSREPNPTFLWLATLAHLSPIARLVTSVNPNMPTRTFGSGLLGSHGFWFYFPVWTSFLALLLISKLKFRPRDPAEAAIEPAPLPAPLAPADEGEGGVSETVIAKTTTRAGTVSVKIGSSTSVQSLDVNAVEKAELVAAETAPMPAVDAESASGNGAGGNSGSGSRGKPDTATVMLPGGSSAGPAEAGTEDAETEKGETEKAESDESSAPSAKPDTETSATPAVEAQPDAPEPDEAKTDDTPTEPVLGTPGAETIPLTAAAVAAAEAEADRAREAKAEEASPNPESDSESPEESAGDAISSAVKPETETGEEDR